MKPIRLCVMKLGAPLVFFQNCLCYNTVGLSYTFRMVSRCFSHTYYVLCFIPYILMFCVCLLFGHMVGWSNRVDLARSTFGVLSVHFFPNLSVVTIQLEHFTLVEWCLFVLTILLYQMCFSIQSIVTTQLEHCTLVEWCPVVLAIVLTVLFHVV